MTLFVVFVMVFGLGLGLLYAPVEADAVADS